MSSEDATAGLDELDVDECRRLLRTGGVGRIAIPGPGAPLLRPVNYVVSEGTLVIRTGDGQILEAARDSAEVAFEIDRIDRLEHAGWSVVVTGTLQERAADDVTRALPLRAWASGRRDYFAAISLDTISGRRISRARIDP